MKKDHKNKFKTPEGYFENFNERLFERLDKEGREVSGVIPKSDGFTVPDGYFDNLDIKVLDVVQKPNTKVIALKSYRKFYYAAASMAAVFALVFFLNNTQKETIQFEDLAGNEIDAYFDINEIGLSSYELAELIEIKASDLEPLNDDPIEDEAIFEYLNENVDAIEDLNLDYDDYEEIEY